MVLILFALAASAAGARAQHAPAGPAGPVQASFTASEETVTTGAVEWPAFLQGTLVYNHTTESPDDGLPSVPWCQNGRWTVAANVKMAFRGVQFGGAEYETVEGAWNANGSCEGSLEWTVGDDEECSWTISGSESGAGTFPSDESGVFLYLYPGSGRADLSFVLFGGRSRKPWSINCSVGGGSGAYEGDGLWATGTTEESLVRGSFTGDAAELTVTMSGSAEWDHGVIDEHYTGNWSGSFGPRALELVVDRDGLASWIPEALSEVEPGNSAAVRALLRYTDGAPADLDAERFTFELVEVSREPGIAMNRPVRAAAATDPDLRFDAARNAGHTVRGDGLALEAAAGKEAVATVSAYDWGAYGTLKVTAHMPGGWTLTAYLDGDPDQKEIRLPLRRSDSRIADAWKAQHRVAGRDDADDAEDQPQGDTHPGDGLSLYEEYRGFYENGRHIYAHPTRKDVFVFDEVGGLVKRAITMFADATDLEVHHGFAVTEYEGDRVINFNHGAGPHLVDQHGIRIVLVPEVRGYAVAAAVNPDDARPGTPGQIRAVEIPLDLIPGASRWAGLADSLKPPPASYVASTVAHELGHAVNIWHHGEDDHANVVWRVQRSLLGSFERDEQGNLLLEEEGFGPIRLFTEAGVRFATRRLQAEGETLIPQMGVQGGQHSGDDRCFMRYDNGKAYASVSAPDVRYFVDREPSGKTLCKHRDGEGVNHPGHAPQSRYGDATRGRCYYQICVNDLHSH